jgi:DNA-directed RNA polymerase subunit RPC12/RpoP
MCRYAFKTYKPHYACFQCRKAFKRRLQQDVDPNGEEKPARCPECNLFMADMGLDFKAPAKQKIKEWKIIESLWTIGITFHSCGCGGPGYRPRDTITYKTFLKDTLKSYQETLQRWVSEKPTTQELINQKTAAITLWKERVTAVKRVLDEV